MQDQIEPAETFFHRCENTPDLVVAGDVAREDQGVRAKGAGEFLNVFLQSIALIREREFGPFAMPRLRDRPRDGTFIGHAEHDPELAVEGTELIVEWGDHGRRIKPVRVTVERFPYLTEPRNSDA